ncbi:hypothetical protein SEA_RITA_53 [Mycobacterium phage Rita]|nr:hypothetical protein SEA_RITA_53 [Mycobacterium phage Rita]
MTYTARPSGLWKALAELDARQMKEATETTSRTGEPMSDVVERAYEFMRSMQGQGELLRDLLAEVEQLQDIIDELIVIGHQAASACWRDVPSRTIDEALGRNAVGNKILAAIEGADQ